MKKYIKFILATFVCTLLLFTNCSKSSSTPEDDQSNLRKIKKSNKIVIDNANRVDRNEADRVIESIVYFYNASGLLSQMDIYDDTTLDAELIAKLRINYFNGVVIISPTINPVDGMYFIHDNQKRISAITVLNLADSVQFFYNNQNQMNDIRIVDSAGLSKHHFDFVYDSYGNLTSYKTEERNNLISRVELSCYTTYTIRNEFDSRFYREETRLFHLGGINTIYMLGLNYGQATKHAVQKRVEYMPNLVGDTTIRVNDFNYDFNSRNEIIYRKMTGSFDTLYYNYEYE